MKLFTSAGASRRIKVLWSLWILLALMIVAIGWYPIRFGSLRALIVVALLVWWAVSLTLLWPHLILRRVGIGLSLCALLFGLAPGRAVDESALRTHYVRSLLNYENTVYVWGGENARGIDCSGLVRRGLIDANWKVGLATLNPAPVRRAVALWWFDCSARALKENHRDWTQTLFTSRSLNDVDLSQLKPGDFAVTSSGVHTLAYLGDKTWIEADPKEWKTIQVRVPSRNAWFGMPVHLMRWRQMQSR